MDILYTLADFFFDQLASHITIFKFIKIIINLRIFYIKINQFIMVISSSD
jgi:hypothetical protein